MKQWSILVILAVIGATGLFGQTVNMTTTYSKGGCYSNCTPPPPSIPEPGTYLLLGGGLTALALLRKKVQR